MMSRMVRYSLISQHSFLHARREFSHHFFTNAYGTLVPRRNRHERRRHAGSAREGLEQGRASDSRPCFCQLRSWALISQLFASAFSAMVTNEVMCGIAGIIDLVGQRPAPEGVVQ